MLFKSRIRVITADQINRQVQGYFQIFRNARVEWVESYQLMKREALPERMVPRAGHEEASIFALDRILAFYRQIGVVAPAAVMLSLTNIKGLRFAGTNMFGDGKSDPIDETHLVLPDLFIEDLNAVASEILRPSFDMIWNAAGQSGSPNYHSDGRRKISR